MYVSVFRLVSLGGREQEKRNDKSSLRKSPHGTSSIMGSTFEIVG